MIHLAGPLVAGVQRCTRCDVILTDYRGAMVPEEEADEPLRGWADGAHVDVTDGNPRQFVVTTDPPDCARVQ